MSYLRAFYSILLATKVNPEKRSVLLKFKGTNLYGGDNTAFVGDIQVLNEAGTLINETKLVNTDFSYPYIAPGGFRYLSNDSSADPARLGWTFMGASGISAQNSPFAPPYTNENSLQQVAILQGESGSFEQIMSLLPGNYKIRFKAAQRENNQNNTIIITVEGVIIKPEFAPTQNTGFVEYFSNLFTV